MLCNPKVILLVAVALTAASLLLWQATGGDYYTKYEVVEKVARQIDPDDPLAQAGFYDTEARVETVTRSDFRFGLLPTPSGLLDKHMVSVASISGPVWGLALGLIWWGRRRQTA